MGGRAIATPASHVHANTLLQVAKIRRRRKIIRLPFLERIHHNTFARTLWSFGCAKKARRKLGRAVYVGSISGDNDPDANSAGPTKNYTT